MGAVGPNPVGGQRQGRSKPATAPLKRNRRANTRGKRPRKTGDSRETPPITARKALAKLVQSILKKNSLFTAQDTAWIAELERLDQDEPETVDILIQEGLLEALKKPGVETFLTADRPS